MIDELLAKSIKAKKIILTKHIASRNRSQMVSHISRFHINLFYCTPCRHLEKEILKYMMLKIYFPTKLIILTSTRKNLAKAFSDPRPNLYRRTEKRGRMLTLLPKKFLKTKRNLFKT